ncbi:MAG: serine protease [Porticoccaceae bacterium]|nr:serine protease [Porticoccaceae bacterium]
MSTRNETTVSLVLGSGGARGLAHIGVIHWLEENGFKIESISGCSVGALIGGIYGAGKLDDFEAWVREIKKVDILTLLDLSWEKSGLVKGDKLFHTLTDLVGDVLIEDLPIKFTAVAADIVNEKELWMCSGKLFDAIRASVSLPLFFTPFMYGDIELIDGGVLNPVPIAPTFSDATDLTIAVNLGGKVDEKDKITRGKETQSEDKSSFTGKIVEFFEGFKEPKLKPRGEDWDAFDIVNLSFDVMQSTIGRQKLAAYPPDVFVEISRSACGILEFDLASEMIDLGYKKAEEALNHLSSSNGDEQQ